MSKNTGGTAFPHAFQEMDRQGMPCAQAYFQEGMTLRDYFAAKAMQGMFASDTESYCMRPGNEHIRAKAAYAMADAMLAERDK